MFVARVIPSAMMFVPSIGGRSHDISENTSDSDIVFGCRVFATAVSLARKIRRRSLIHRELGRGQRSTLRHAGLFDL